MYTIIVWPLSMMYRLMCHMEKTDYDSFRYSAHGVARNTDLSTD